MRYKILYLLVLGVALLNSCKKELRFDEDGVLVPKTVVENSTLGSISVNGVLLHSETYGNPNNPMLLVIHGGPGGDYRGLLNYKQLANDSMFVVFYDQRGSGLSERLDKDNFTNVQQYIDELDGVINHYRQNDSQKVILAGHSWGAMLATAYVNQKPMQIDGVILAEPGGFTWEQAKLYFSRSRKLELFSEQTNDFVYQDQFISGHDHNTLDYKLALSLAGVPPTGDVKAPPYWRYGAVCNKASIELANNNPDQMNFTTNLHNYSTKVLFAYSQLNTAYGREHAVLLSSTFPNVQLKEINGCGHEIPYFGWNNLYPIIQNYLTEIL